MTEILLGKIMDLNTTQTVQCMKKYVCVCVHVCVCVCVCAI